MARNKPNKNNGHVGGDKPTQSGWQQPDNARFVNINFNDTDKQWLQANMAEGGQMVDELFIMAHKDAARVSIVPDSKSGRFNATYTSYDTNSPRYGLIMSCRASSPALAIFALAYAAMHKVGAWEVSANSATDLFG